VKKLNKYANGTASYIEEGLVRRELSDNFVYYSPTNYDDLTAAAEWAQDTLQVHASDPREWTYTTEELTLAQSHDGLWNAAQLQLTEQGTMHGFLRMYWAKKILEWTPNPSVALRTAQYLNDKYALDGNDPNGFVGVGWSIMGIHDMGWKEREIFGKIRYMNYAGCKRKFLVDEFVNKYSPASENAIKAAAAVGKEAEGTKKKASAVKGTAKKAPPTTAGPTSAGKKRKA
jgi:deoxyribodipyrimidine photo-lyase